MIKNFFVLVFLIFTLFCKSQNLHVFDSLSLLNDSKNLSQFSNSINIKSWTIKINEFCAKNESIIPDEYGEYDDWIEVFNFGEDTIDINGLYITDDLNNPQKWQINDELIILPDSFIVLWADSEPDQGINHLGFSLSGDGEEIGIFTLDSLVLIDSVIFNEQISNVSMGRQPDGGQIWNNFLVPTPGMSNTTQGLYGITPKPEISVQGGFFNAGFYFTINTDLDSAQIFYTLDNSEPTISSLLYTDSVYVNSTVAVRARAFKDDYIPGYIATETYMFDYDFTLDAISLVTNPDNLWGSTGIYNHPTNGLEKPIHFEYFTADGSPVFQTDCGIKIHAPDSRSQKSLRFYARSEYGNKAFNYPFFDDLDIDSFKRLILRNGGNDGFELGKTQIRDPLSHIIYKQCNLENGISSYKPVNVFLNGEYWGIYNLRERQDEHYIESNYDEYDFDFLEYDNGSPEWKNAIIGDWQNYDSLKNFVSNNDIGNDDNYTIVRDWMDIENFVDYQIFEIFIGNQDWLSNNTRFWRPNRPDGKWNWVLWDTEYGLALFYPDYNIGLPDFNFLYMAMTWGGWGNGDYTYLLRNLADNSEFLEYFNIRFADVLNSQLKEDDNIIEVIDSLNNLVYHDAQYQFKKWGGNNYINWETKIQEIKDFVNERPYYIREHIINEYGLDTLFTLHLDVQPEHSGRIKINTICVAGFPWTGQYFADYITEITAIPNPGFVFEGWEGISSNNPGLFVSSIADTSFKAIFHENSDSSVLIHEINYNSAGFFDAEDWIELKNKSSQVVNISGWILKNEIDDHIFEIAEGSILDPESFIVLCKDTLQFKIFYPEINNITGNLDFSLSGNGEVIRLYNHKSELVDLVHYYDSDPWSHLPDGNGPTLELIDDSLNNDVSDNWRASYTIGGTPGFPNSIQAPVHLLINEFMAANDTTIADPQGEFDDWIELFNAGEQYIDLGGMYITDDLSNPTEWQMPDNEADSTIILPDEFLLLWADNDSDDGILHLDIKLSASGEQIAVFEKDGITLLDSLTFGEQSTDISLGRQFNGGENWIYMTRPTPGESNTFEINVEFNVCLEGPFNGVEMNNDLIYNQLPLFQPFNIQPWNYTGPEFVNKFPNQSIVDWILVELRDAANSSVATSNSIIMQKAGFIHKNGTVTDIDGINHIPFDIYYSDSLYLVVKHRNHLGVMTAFALKEYSGIYSYDFTTPLGQAYGTDAQKDLGNGVYGLFGGDGNADGIINIDDKTTVWSIEVGGKGYLNGDFNMDTQTDNSDKNDIWQNNNSKSSQIPN